MKWTLLVCMLVSLVGSHSCPFGCRCELQIVNCSSRQLLTLPFVDDMEVEIFDVSYNDIKLLPNYLLDAPNLLHLNLSHNQLTSVPESFLLHCPHLLTLDLSYNYLRYISDLHPSSFITFNYNLHSLNLSSNPLKFISNRNTFIHSSSLQIIDLSDCALTYFTATSLTNLTNLKTLILSQNPLKKIFNLKSNSLTNLKLINSQLYLIDPQIFTTLNSLKEIDFSFNPNLIDFTTTPNQNLLYLKATHCNLNHFNISTLINLEIINLKNNKINKINYKMFELNLNLKFIDLSINPITFIDPNSFNHLILDRLDLSSTFLTEINFYNFYYVKILNISRNEILYLKGGKSNLEVLDASHCEIYEIEIGFLNGLKDLKILNLSRNNLEIINDLGINNKVQILDLNFNRLINLEWLKYFKNLRYLNLIGNRISNGVSLEWLAKNKEIEIKAQNNPWNCECTSDFLKFKEFMKIREEFDELICASPKNVSGLKWDRVCNKHEKKFRTSLFLPVLLSVLSIMSLICVFVIIKKAVEGVRVERVQETPVVSLGQTEQVLPSYEEALLMPSPWKVQSKECQTSDEVVRAGSLKGLSRAGMTRKVLSSSSL